MANWFKDELTNRNFLSPIGFRFVLEKAKKTAFLCQKAEIPNLTLGQVEIPTRGYAVSPIEGNIKYSDLNIDFIVDEDLRNYMEIHNWIRALGLPSDTNERKEWEDVWRQKGTAANSQNIKYSDATLQVLNSNYKPSVLVNFKDTFPISLSTLDFDVTMGDNEYFTATATFQYTLYEVRDPNSTSRKKSYPRNQ